MFKLLFRAVARPGVNWKKLHTSIPALCKPKPRVIQNFKDNVHPSAHIKIKSNVFTTIDSFSIHANLNCDDFQVNLFDKSSGADDGGCEEDRKAEAFICVDDQKENVEVNIQKNDENADILCEMHIPHNCSIIINSTDSVSIARIFGNILTVRAEKNIMLRTVRFQNMLISTECGTVTAEHVLLGGVIKIDTKDSNCISLGNVIGAKMFCKTDAGNISTKSCFVEESNFETNTGNLTLNNLHKSAKVTANKKSNIDIRGLRGRVQVLGKSTGNLNMHMSKIIGESCINCDQFKNATVFVSDSILKSVDISVVSDCITLDESLEKQSKGLSSDKKKFDSKGKKSKGKNKLIMSTKQAAMKMGTISWPESILELKC
ncbi:uncharacterized protein LOC119684524 [Teleopsis dalmanni]|uniref:uncharacterized protein LOC119684524 n=1 Tax=Teleopsis dalmanni TaxID=139649 RepID=UPI0018CEC6C7|nr:uncharacterized protein LOC119684524 [Teleopsis dalmanni]